MTVFRPSDTRPRHDVARAAALGIQRYESQRLILYTDIEPEFARTLPPLMDQAYAAWVAYFGPLPPNREGTEYQLTGYLMRNKDLFRQSGMLTADVDTFIHGRHRGAEFWLNDQELGYYRRHLLLHEATHCFMTTMPGSQLPIWYLEGMAEYFGTHTLGATGQAQFGVMPDNPRNFLGLGRINVLQQEVAAGRFRSVADISERLLPDFTGAKAEPYAWSWAFCTFLDQHPRYRERFRSLGTHLWDGRFYPAMRDAFAPDMSALIIEWELFIRHLDFGYDVPRAAIEFRKGETLSPGQVAECSVAADRGWQPSGVWVERGRSYDIAAAGQIAVAQEPRPWVSEPQGVSIRYAAGQPIGRLVMAVQSETPPDAAGQGSLLTVFDVGRETRWTAPVDGTIYFRVNDFWSSLTDNTGAYAVSIRPH